MTKMRFESAPTVRVEQLQEKVFALLRHIASLVKEPEDTEEEWLSYTFVTDESRLTDFLYEESDLVQLSELIGITGLTMRDLIFNVASRLKLTEG